MVKGLEGKSNTPTNSHFNLICRGLLAGPKYASAINCGERDLLVNQDMQATAQAQVIPATGTGTPCSRHRYSLLQALVLSDTGTGTPSCRRRYSLLQAQVLPATGIGTL